MTRPHTEFVQSQVLPWQAAHDFADRQGAEVKVLSRNSETGAVSALFRYPAGWQRQGVWHLQADEEYFVLAGDLSVGAVEYAHQCYAALPAGYPRRGASSKSGAVVLTYLGANPAMVSGEPSAEFDTRKLVEFVEVPTAIEDLGTEDFARWRKRNWRGWRRESSADLNPEGIGMKILREDPDTQEATWIMGGTGAPLKDGQKGSLAMMVGSEVLEDFHMERHGAGEEVYTLAGAVTCPFGTMNPGAYLWRGPHIWHGPYGLHPGGFMHIMRSHGGQFLTDYQEECTPIDPNQAYDPILSPELDQYRSIYHHPYPANH